MTAISLGLYFKFQLFEGGHGVRLKRELILGVAAKICAEFLYVLFENFSFCIRVVECGEKSTPSRVFRKTLRNAKIQNEI